MLPFFQYALADFQLLPVVMGPGDLAGVTREIGAVVDADTLLVVSSDLSQGLPPSEASDYDRRTLYLLLALEALVCWPDKTAPAVRFPWPSSSHRPGNVVGGRCWCITATVKIFLTDPAAGS
ncbi:MAG: AmmeMemoRadiSam system protein B [Desulfobacterales bacterium]|jgi:hypothetical protein|nr:AmmeMemoRadiSam system protein B [Desulfobacterales bacterium]